MPKRIDFLTFSTVHDDKYFLSIRHPICQNPSQELVVGLIFDH